MIRLPFAFSASSRACRLRLLAAALLPLTGHANGTRLPGQSVEQVAKGYAFAAGAEGPSALYVNPAGLAAMDAAAIEASLHLVHSRYERDAASTDTTALLPALFVAQPLPGDWVLGLGTYVPYGSSSEWGRETDFATIALKSEITYHTIALGLARPVGRHLRLGAAIEWNENDTHLSQALGPGPAGLYRFEARDGAPSFTVGLTWTPAARHRFAFAYHSQTCFDLEGDAHVSAFGITTPASARWDYPEHALIAYRVQLTDRLDVELQFERTFWSGVSDSRIIATGLPAQPLPLNWRDSDYYNLGATYAVTPDWRLSAGVSRSTNSIPDEAFTPALPDVDKWIFTTGTVLTFGPLSWSFALNYSPAVARTVAGRPANAFGQSVNGRYKSGFVGLSSGLRWDF
jgi:long-chain fatty acid transport protein